MIDTKINKNITMKKNLILRLMLPMLILSHFVNAQSNAQEKNNLSVKKDDIIIDVFYGWPYFNGTVLKSLSDGYNLTNAKNTNHLGGKAEYMLTENIGLGAEFTYANSSIRYQSSINGFYEIAGVSKIRALGRFNYHFSATEMLDPYATFGIGYKKILIDNSYFTLQSGLNIYHSNSKFTKVFFNKIEAKNLKNQFYIFEPEVLLSYKASEYVDIGFSITGNITTYKFDPYKLKLDESDYKLSFTDIKLKNNVVSFLTFGFQCNWYLQFEKLE